MANPCQILQKIENKPTEIPELEWLCNKGLIWIDLDSTESEDIDFLARECNFHPLAIEDCINKNQRPKLDEYDSYLFIVLHRFHYDTDKKNPKKQRDPYLFQRKICGYSSPKRRTSD